MTAAREGDKSGDGNRRGPVGRDAVVAVAVEHAADLFAERGPAATSIRDIAERAGVNHGLLFRHFGAKDQLVAMVLQHLATQTADQVAEGRISVEDPRVRRHWIVLARCILDGYPVERLQEQFPGMSRMRDDAREFHDSDRAAALAVAHTAAFVLGWQLFGNFLRTAGGLGDIPERALRDSIDARALDLFRSADTL